MLAHEIAHLLFEGDQILHSSNRLEKNLVSSRFSYKEIEHLCDFGGREILLPLYSIRAELRNVLPSLSVVMRISDEAECSLVVAAQQICEPIMLWDCTFIFWQQTGDCLTAREVFPKNKRQIEILDDANSLVRRSLRSRDIVTGIEKLDLFDRVETFQAEAICTGPGSALLMIQNALA